jgi:hypothetical protein
MRDVSAPANEPGLLGVSAGRASVGAVSGCRADSRVQAFLVEPFAVRMGFEEPNTSFQVAGIDSRLRNSLWSAFLPHPSILSHRRKGAKRPFRLTALGEELMPRIREPIDRHERETAKPPEPDLLPVTRFDTGVA